MADPHLQDDRSLRIPLVLLGSVLAWLVIARPGNLGGDWTIGHAALVLSTAALAGIAWRFHGLLAALAVVTLFLIADPVPPPEPASAERPLEAFCLLSLWLGIAGASRLARPGWAVWLALAIGSAAGTALLLLAPGFPPTEDPVSRERIIHLALCLGLPAFLASCLGPARSMLDRLKLLATTLLIPAAVVGIVGLSRGQPPLDWERASWGTLPSEWNNAWSDGSWNRGAWCWTVGWASAILLAFGAWRMLARGRRQWQRGHAPVAWLPAVGCLAGMAVLGARPIAAGSMLLAGAGALLAVFGVADFIQAMVERIALEPPEPGPSNIPRVK